MGYEIIDQNNFVSPTLNRELNDNLSILNDKSIILPLGEVKISRKISSVLIGIIAIILGIIFKGQNVAFMVGLAFAVAASTKVPILYLTISWIKLTTNGALYGGFIGLFSAIILVILGPMVWVETLGFEKPIFPYKYPRLF